MSVDLAVFDEYTNLSHLKLVSQADVTCASCDVTCSSYDVTPCRLFSGGGAERGRQGVSHHVHVRQPAGGGADRLHVQLRGLRPDTTEGLQAAKVSQLLCPETCGWWIGDKTKELWLVLFSFVK